MEEGETRGGWLEDGDRRVEPVEGKDFPSATSEESEEGEGDDDNDREEGCACCACDLDCEFSHSSYLTI